MIAPFSELICARTEQILGCPDAKNLTLKESLKDLPRLIRVELLKLAFSISFLALIFIVSALAGPFGFVGTLLGFWVIAFEFVDYPMEVRRRGFRERLNWATRSFLPLTAFGVLLLGLMSIPIVGVLGLPVGIVGGTLVYHNIEGGRRLPARKN